MILLKKVEVSVYFNGACNYYRFLMDKDTFMESWNNHLLNIGYYSANDEKGRHVIINPSNCVAIEILEIEA